jgi:ankyrin repeat protein
MKSSRKYLLLSRGLPLLLILVLLGLYYRGTRPNINAKDAAGRTPFTEAVSKRKNSTARLLLAHGADVSVKTRRGKTALDLATADKNKELISLISKVSSKTMAL